MTDLDDQIATYLNAIEVEGKTIATQAHFRSIGRCLGDVENHRSSTADSPQS
jgi:hypothetical protein